MKPIYATSEPLAHLFFKVKDLSLFLPLFLEKVNLLPVDRRALEDRSNKIGGCRSKKQGSSIGAKPLDRKVQSHSTVRRGRGSI